MQSLNVLIVGNNSSKVLKNVINSRYLNKLYADFETDSATEIRFNTFQELAQKCKALKIDIVIVENEKYLNQGIADILRKNFINCIGINSYWAKLVLSREFARQKLTKYHINIPNKLLYPVNFPIILKADGIILKAHSLQEIIFARQRLLNCSPEIEKTVFLEEFIDGKEYELVSFFDGKNLIGYCENSLIQEYQTKLQNMFLEENKDFLGFITSKLIIREKTLYNVGFKTTFPTISSDIDILYLISSGVYQKLNEININNPL